MKTWSVVFLKTTRRATSVIHWDDEGVRHVDQLPDSTPKRGIYAGEFALDLESIPDGVENKMFSAFMVMCSKGAKALGLDVGGSFAFFANEKARLLEVTPL